ncbi:hypothetical protein GDO81_009525 [Engystomops pustulosus]|uniref:AP complex mu/sigma subunit domain-containing protein n=1 Tax=Engystomops pustulosus TaxID=76066 RepID=A0AAV7BRJ4_ENGPU|nr:hypothetical protein GDO81_009525 [Engystomops pustulosus]
MIKAILVFNNHGKPRFMRFYQHFPEEMQQQIVRETFHLVSKRDDNVCNFLEGGSLIGGSDYKLIYRHYATLYFVFCVDSSESELGILDLIQVFVETLDKCFENVCELDLIFNVDKSWAMFTSLFKMHKVKLTLGPSNGPILTLKDLLSRGVLALSSPPALVC